MVRFGLVMGGEEEGGEHLPGEFRRICCSPFGQVFRGRCRWGRGSWGTCSTFRATEWGVWLGDRRTVMAVPGARLMMAKSDQPR